MPPKRRRNNNNKKKNKGKAGPGPQCNNAASARNTTNSHAASRSTNSNNDSTSCTLEGETPTQQWGKWKQHRNMTTLDDPTFYFRYKEAGKRFMNYMRETCPSEMEKDGTCHSLLVITDWMAATGHTILRSVLKDLKLTIRIRARVAKSMYGGGDAGHKYFLGVLTYCWSILHTLPQNTIENDVDRFEPQEERKEVNPFDALLNEDEEEEEEEELFPSNPVPRPLPLPSGSGSLSLEELLHSDDRHDAILFLVALDEIMETIVKQYQTSVLGNLRQHQRIGCPETAIVEELMEAAVATNMAIQQVQQLEMDLMVQHPHLTTPYRLLATLVLPELTQDIMAIVGEHGAKIGCVEKDISIYLGDSMECCFRNSRDPYNQNDTIVQIFCRRWQIDSVGITKLEQYQSALQLLVKFEIPVMTGEKLEVAREQQSTRLPAAPSSYRWIQNMPCIGGDRAIHHTIRLLQTFGDVIRDTPLQNGIEAKRGLFGKSPWVPGRSHKISDLDELLMADILPKMVLMCRKGVIGVTNLPMENEVCPLYVLLRKYVEEPHKPVSWSIAFAVHAMMTAVLEVGPVFETLVVISKQVFENYFDSLRGATVLAEQNNQESIGDKSTIAGKIWWGNMASVSFLENLGLPVFGDRTLWNPLCAGTTLSYLSYFGNMEVGCALVDCHAQLRITLHLFHALVVNDIVRTGEIPMLDRFFDSFRNSKAIWGGGRRLPERGEFVHRFWMCFGNNAADTKRMVDEARETFRGVRQPQRFTNTPKAKGHRNLVPVEPAEISKSYRRICHRDYHGVVDNYHTPEQRRRCKGSDQYLLSVRINDTLDAIEEEQKLLSLNLPNCSVLMEQFVNSLGRILQWEPILANGAARLGQDSRQGFAYLFAQYLLGALDFADNPYGYEFLEVPLGQASAHVMKGYFGRINPQKATWFQAIQEEE